MLNWQDTERMAKDVKSLAADIGQGYINMGKEPPPMEDLLLQGHCAWTLMLVNRIFTDGKRAREVERAERASKPVILQPSGKRF